MNANFGVFEWLMSLCNELAQFTTWLTTPLPITGSTPLFFVTFGGIVAIIMIHVVLLFTGIGRL